MECAKSTADDAEDELQRHERELRRLALARAKDVTELNEQLALRERKLQAAQADLARLTLESEERRQNLAAVDHALKLERRQAADLAAAAAGTQARVHALETALFVMKNRFSRRATSFAVYWTRRLLVQVPLLLALFLLNFASNLYLLRETPRRRQQAFPGAG